MYGPDEPPPEELLRAPCLLPGCERSVSYTLARGRPKLFCGDTHRKLHAERRQRLLRGIEALEASITALPTAAVTRALRAETALLRWHLVRFPDTKQQHGTGQR